MRLTEEIQQLGAMGAVGMYIQTSEEAINYQPRSLFGCLMQLFICGLFIYAFGLIASGNAAGPTYFYKYSVSAS